MKRNVLHRYLQGFLIGMLFEYTIRVQVHFIPLILIVILTLNAVIDLYTAKN